MHGNRPIAIKHALSQASLFADLGMDALARIARASSSFQLSQNELLVEKGCRCDGLYLVVYGQIKLFFTSSQGLEKVADLIGEAEIFGETLMFAEQHYPYSGQALTDSLVVHVPGAAVLEEMDVNSGLRKKLFTHMSLQLYKLINQDQVNAQQSGTERFIRYLLGQIPVLAKDGREVEVKLPTSKSNISSLLNLTKEHFSRILRSLSQRGLISVNGYRILIPDVSLLMNYQDRASLC